MMDIRITTLIYMRENGQEPPSSISFAEQDALVSDELSWAWQLTKRLQNVSHNFLTSRIFQKPSNVAQTGVQIPVK